jgi:ribonucleotide reductase alpha subunit
MKNKMEVKRYYTKDFTMRHHVNVYNIFKWKKVDVIIKNDQTGEIIFEGKDLEFPEHYSQNACDIIAKMYFRKTGVPDTGHETSMFQVAHRMVNFWVNAMIDEGLISEEDRSIVYNELMYMLLNQMWAPNSPQWFNTGLWNEYRIEGDSRGFRYSADGIHEESGYKYTPGSACFITKINDSLLGNQSIMDSLTTHTRLFRYGSGIGTNYSPLRAKDEKLSAGGRSSGLMSFLKVFDRNAGAIKSGGAARRAAVMAALDLDHPEILNFVRWKAREEDKVVALGKMGYDTSISGEVYETVSGQNMNNSVRIPDEFMEMVKTNDDSLMWETKGRVDDSVNQKINVRQLWDEIAWSAWRSGDPGVQFSDTINRWNTCSNVGRINSSNPCLSGNMKILTKDGYVEIRELDGKTVDIVNKDGKIVQGNVWCSGIKETIVLVMSDMTEIECTPDHVFMTVDGNSIQAKDAYGKMLASYQRANAQVIDIRTGSKQKVYDFSEPETHWGVVDGLITHNCGEFLFLDDSACNLASINVLKFYNTDTGIFDFQGYTHAITLIQMVLEATIHWGYFPTPEIAQNSYNFRPTGLGITNLGALIMAMGYRYASSKGSQIAANLCSIMTGQSYLTSIQMAEVVGPFPAYKSVEESMMNVISASQKKAVEMVKQYKTERNPFDSPGCTSASIFSIGKFIKSLWRDVFNSASSSGFRNASVSLLAPTGTISFAMDCVTTSLEPFYSHITHKKLVDGSWMKMINPIIPIAMKRLGYEPEESSLVQQHILDNDGMIENCKHLKNEHIAVFDTAAKCGKGKRYISPEDHVWMVAAIQPHVTMGISKTINLPEDATVKDIKNLYMLAWRLGCKSITVYRDKCKSVQPLTTTREDVKNPNDLDSMNYYELLEYAKSKQSVVVPKSQPVNQELRSEREKLPHEPKCIKNVIRMANQNIHVIRSFYDDGRIGEIFVTAAKQGNTVRGFLEVLSMVVSKALQYGMPPEILSRILRGHEFNPNGMVQHHPNIKQAASIPDLMSKFLDISTGNYQFCQVKPDNGTDKDVVEKIREREDSAGEESEILHGEVCEVCSSDKMIRVGTCKYCTVCGSSTGCS